MGRFRIFSEEEKLWMVTSFRNCQIVVLKREMRNCGVSLTLTDCRSRHFLIVFQSNAFVKQPQNCYPLTVECVNFREWVEQWSGVCNICMSNIKCELNISLSLSLCARESLVRKTIKILVAAVRVYHMVIENHFMYYYRGSQYTYSIYIGTI